MTPNIMEAHLAITRIKEAFTNADIVLSEIISMQRKQTEGVYTREMIFIIPPKLNITPEHFRKILSELTKCEIIKKEGSLFKINTDYIKL